MKKLIALAALMVALPAMSNGYGERSYDVEESLAKIYACYWYYSDNDETEKARLMHSAHSKAAMVYSNELGSIALIESASRNMVKLYSQINYSYDLSELCPAVHDIVVQSKL